MTALLGRVEAAGPREARPREPARSCTARPAAGPGSQRARRTIGRRGRPGRPARASTRRPRPRWLRLNLIAAVSGDVGRAPTARPTTLSNADRPGRARRRSASSPTACSCGAAQRAAPRGTGVPRTAHASSCVDVVAATSAGHRMRPGRGAERVRRRLPRRRPRREVAPHARRRRRGDGRRRSCPCPARRPTASSRRRPLRRRLREPRAALARLRGRAVARRAVPPRRPVDELCLSTSPARRSAAACRVLRGGNASTRVRPSRSSQLLRRRREPAPTRRWLLPARATLAAPRRNGRDR